MTTAVAIPPGVPPASPLGAGPNAVASRLGYAGLLPFIGGALLVWLVREEVHAYVTLALVAYGGLIASFLGGIHWGLAFRQSEPPARWLAWGVVPSVVAWVAVIMPPSAGLVIVGVLLLVCYAVDRVLYVEQGVARWLTLRFRLSAIASLSCFIGAAGS